MSNAYKSGKRIVSKGRYAANIAKKITLSWFGVGTTLIGTVALVGCVLALQLLLAHNNDWAAMLACLFMGAALICFPLMLIYFGVTAVKEAKQIDLGTPHTHANTADLPAPESLVRASQEPAQLQEAVLLRAAGETQEQHEEQLLRASGEQA